MRTEEQETLQRRAVAGTEPEGAVAAAMARVKAGWATEKAAATGRRVTRKPLSPWVKADGKWPIGE